MCAARSYVKESKRPGSYSRAAGVAISQGEVHAEVGRQEACAPTKQMKKRHLIAGGAALVTAAVATKLLIRPRDVDWEKNRRLIFHADHSRFTTVDKVRLHYQEAGDPAGPPLVLIHGFSSSTLVWSRVFLRLAAEGFRVIAVDLLGYGYSGKPRNGEYTMAAQARLIMGLLDNLGIERAHLVGSSYGGGVAAICALDYPDKLQKLVLVGSVSNNEATKYLLLRLFRLPLLGDLVSPFLLSSRRLLRKRMRKAYERHSWVLDERRVEARHRPLRAANTHRAIIRTVRRWDAERIGRDAHLISQPTLLLWGDNDPEIPLRHGEQLARSIAGSRLVVFRNCGHLPQEEYPLGFTEVVSEFCFGSDDR